MWLILWLLMASGFDVQVTPQVALAGNALHMSCFVPRAPDNRWLEFGTDSNISTRQLDGTRAPQIFDKYVQHITCSDTAVFCRVTTAQGKSTLRTRDITVLGCNN